MRLKIMRDKIVIVTGGGKGIGYGISQAFADEGATLVITGRTEVTLSEAEKELKSAYGIDVLPIVANGGDEESVKAAVTKVIGTFGKIDVLINNAQASKSGLLLENHTKEDFDLAIYSGLYATFFYMKYSFPYLKQAGGRVINFASGAGISGKAGQSSYAASKEGVRGLSRVAAAEWGQFGINVNTVCPLVYTKALDSWRKEYPALYEKTIRDIPLGRFGDAENDIGRVCVFLASDDAAYITGETIQVQGGVGLRP